MIEYDFSFPAIIAALAFLVTPITCVGQTGLVQENPPIHFYGKAVDQNGEPVGDAKVTLDIINVREGGYRNESKPLILQTAQGGTFQVTDVTGYSLDNIWITKEGYELSPKTIRSYLFGIHPDYVPDPGNPVIFKMWKLTQKEQLVGSAWHGKVACDGATNRFKLSTGKPSPNGDLEIVCSRTPVDLPPGNTKPYTYKLDITIIGGGIRDTDDEFTYLAPQNGYLPKVSYGQSADNPHWDRTTPIPKNYYIKTVEGQYGTLSIDWQLAHTPSPTYLEWNCSINPSGSRNLER